MGVEDHLLYGEPDFARARVARVRVGSTVDDSYPARLQQGNLESYPCERAIDLRGHALVDLRVEVSPWYGSVRRRRMTLHGHVVRFTGSSPLAGPVDLHTALPHPDDRTPTDSAPDEGER